MATARGSRRSLIHAHVPRDLKGRVHTKTRHHRHQPVIRSKARGHEVWRKRRI